MELLSLEFSVSSCSAAAVLGLMQGVNLTCCFLLVNACVYVYMYVHVRVCV